LVWHLYAGLCGNSGIGLVLKRKNIRSPAEIICYACSFLRYRAGLKKKRIKKINCIRG
jgi:hypothetical protein